MDNKRLFEYEVKVNSEVVNKGRTISLNSAKNAFKGFGRNSYGSIKEILPEGITEIGYKKIGKCLYCWE